MTENPKCAPPKRQAEKGQTGYAEVARENLVALSLSVTEPLSSYDSKTQENTHLIILVRSKHPDSVAPPPVSLSFPRALPTSNQLHTKGNIPEYKK